MREWKFYITGSIYADTLGETTADIEDAKAIGRCFVIKSNGNAAKMRDVIHEVQANETDDIVVHKLAEIAADCAWCEREYGQNNNDTKGN